MHRTRYSLGGLVVFSLLLLTLGTAAYVTINLEPVNRRLEVLPYYARTYINKVRPKPVLPTPPAVSAIDAETLLQARPEGVPETDSETAPTEPNQVASPSSDVPGSLVGVTDGAPTSGPSGVKLVESSVTQVLPIAPAVTLAGFEHEWQTWNNCGPATISMNLSYYGHGDTQVEAAQFLKPNQDDKNVNPDELVAYARSAGFESVAGYGGNIDLLKHLLSNGFPVMVEAWTEPEDNGGMGHYQLLTGYDQADNRFFTEDSLHGAGVTVPINEFDDFWRVFNRTYLVLYPPDKAGLVHAILGSSGDRTTMYEQALLTAQDEAKTQPDDAFAWFNIGTNYARLGEPALAASAFDEARRLGLPYRMLWYQFDIFETYLAMGRHQELVELATATIKATGGLEELYYYRGLALQATNQPEAAAADFQAALAYNPHFDLAAQALAELGY
jgi:tetratricopeptide (TPR) repeat protein